MSTSTNTSTTTESLSTINAERAALGLAPLPERTAPRSSEDFLRRRLADAVRAPRVRVAEWDTVGD